MKNKDNNIIDKFLAHYDNMNAINENIEYQKVYKKPSRFKCIVGFIFSLLCFIFLIAFFVFKVMYFVILLFNILILAYYAINLFTEKGIGLPKMVPVKNIDYSSKGDLLSSDEENLLKHGTDKEINKNIELERKDFDNKE